MYINEYENNENPTVIPLAPMLVSGEDLYKLVGRILKGGITSFRLIRAVTERRENIPAQRRNTMNLKRFFWKGAAKRE